MPNDELIQRAAELNRAEEEAREILAKHAKHLFDQATTARVGHLIDVIRTLGDDLQRVRGAHQERIDFVNELTGQEY